MEYRQNRLAKVLSVLVMVALPFIAFSSPALAQGAQLFMQGENLFLKLK